MLFPIMPWQQYKLMQRFKDVSGFTNEGLRKLVSNSKLGAIKYNLDHRGRQ